MRARFALILLLILSATSVAEGQVYTGHNFPTIGEEYLFHTDTAFNPLDSNMLMSPGPWDFATTEGYFTDTVTFVTVGATGLAGHFPNATFAIEDYFNTAFLSELNGNYVIHGETEGDPGEAVFPKVNDGTAHWLNLPLQLGVAGRDTFLSQVAVSGAEIEEPIDSLIVRSVRYRHDTVDATGVIELPGLILDNAIRRIRTDSVIDSMFIKTGGIWSFDSGESGIRIETSFEWYHPDKDWLVAQALKRGDWIQYFRYAVSPPPSVRLAFSGLPTDMSVLDSITSFEVRAYSIATGNLVPEFEDSVTIEGFNPDGGTSLYCQIAEPTVKAVSGVATFTDLLIIGPGQILFRAFSDTVLADTSELLHIHPIASHFDLNMHSYSVLENDLLPIIEVSAKNDSGFVDTLYYNGDVRVGKLSGSGELLGTYSRPLVNGIATFDDLRITHQGQYKLVFYAPSEQVVGGVQGVPLGYVAQDTLTVNVDPNPGTWIPHYTDTLSMYVDRANEFFWTGNADGYLSGTSRGAWSEIGQHFDFQGQARLTKVLIHFANRLHVGDDTDTFQIKIYDAGLLESNYHVIPYPQTFKDSLPISLVGTQYFAADSVHFDDFWIRNPTTFEFDNPPTVNSSFIVSVVTNSELSNDTIILWTNITGDPQQEYRTSRLTDLFSNPPEFEPMWVRDKYDRPSYDVDLMIEAVLEVDTLSTIVSINGLTGIVEMKVKPNPFTDYLMVELLGENDIYNVQIYSVRGKIQYSNWIDGNASTQLNLGFLSAGVYGLVLRDIKGIKRNAFKILKTE